MKKLKTLLFSTVPLFLSVGIQLIVIYYMLLVASFFMFVKNPALTMDMNTSMNTIFDLMMNIHFQALMSIVFSICCIVLFGMWYYSRCGGDFKVNLKKEFHPLELAGIVCLIPGTQFLSNLLAAAISVLFPSWLETYEELIESAGLTGDIPLLMILYSVILAPISEELIFRGVILRIGKRAFSFWVANILQAFLFGAFHQNMLQGCYTFVLGLFLGYICEKGGTIYHAIFFHFLFNLWGTHAADLLGNINPMIYSGIVIIGSIVCTIGGIRLFKKGNREKQRIFSQNHLGI